jgi:quinolinate synthase
VKEFQTKEVIFLPDSLMGKNFQEELKSTGSDIDLIYPGKYDENHGSCEVHEQITADMIRAIRKEYHLTREDPTTAVLVHWECKPEVLKQADFYGSTSAMIRHITGNPQLKKVYLGTECEMTSNLQNEFPQIEFVRTCAVTCTHMAKITIDKILETLEKERPEVTVPEEIRVKALKSIHRMLAIQEQK